MMEVLTLLGLLGMLGYLLLCVVSVNHRRKLRMFKRKLLGRLDE